MNGGAPRAASLQVAKALDGQRLWRRLMDLATFGATPDGGVNRLALSAEEGPARRYLLAVAEQHGLAATTDVAGNLFIRLAGTEPDLPPVLTGSHLDTQPTGGRFDGVYGVVAALEVLETLVAMGLRPRRSIDVVAWMNEEGARFTPGMMGSEAFAGRRAIDEILATADHLGVTVGAALASLEAALPPLPTRTLGFPIAAYVEAHIEQGPRLEAAGIPIGVVTGIQGKQTYRAVVEGEEGHAGTQAMADRRDALMTALRVISAMKSACEDADPDLFFTIGRFDVLPNAPSVVPAKVCFSVDLRHADTNLMRKTGRHLLQIAAEQAPPCRILMTPLVDAASETFSPDIRGRIAALANALGFDSTDLLSAAGHDARHLAALAPTGMIFIPSRDGISHNEKEWSEPAHVTAGARVLAAVLLDLAS